MNIDPKEIDRKYVAALNHVEAALREVAEIKKLENRPRHRLLAGEAEINRGYAIISAARPLT